MTEQYEYASIRVEMASDATIRDYFAAKVMQGDFAAQSDEVRIYSHHLTDEQLADMSKFFYRMADAMLKARG
ncbi:Uncharacterised protein [Providencia rustigianii]|nr:Uncharacterised protein [Providencia rustigianii]